MWNLNTIWYSSAYINTLFYNNYMYIYIYLCIQPFGFSNLAPSEFQPRMGKTDIPRIVYMSKEDLSVLCFCVVSGVWFDFGGHQLLWFQLGWCLLSLVVFIQAAGAKLGAVRYSKSCRLSVRGQDITQKNLGPNLASKWHPRNRRFNSPYTFFTSGLVLKQQTTLETRQSSPWGPSSWDLL